MSVCVLGADGYIGWPLVCRLAATCPEPIIAVDDLSKRRRVHAAGLESALPILSFDERIDRLRRVTGRFDVTGITASVTDCIEDLVREHRPRAVVHLAQIPSAPYSMASAAAALETLANNELGNLAVLFAIRDHSPDTHLVKMGSLGEYAAVGVPLGEGYVDATIDGVPAARPIPFPREADDVYHVTKINDSNFVSMACRVWRLRITEVMQSVVYGLSIPATDHPGLSTRFDCDPVFGSVLNRFIAQAILGTPLTVFGGGRATTGLIALTDTIDALAHWIDHPGTPGTHKVVNQTAVPRVAILELAHMVAAVCAAEGISVRLDFSDDPRHEGDRAGSTAPVITARLTEAGVVKTSLVDGMREAVRALLPHRARLAAAAHPARVDWLTGEGPAFKGSKLAQIAM